MGAMFTGLHECGVSDEVLLPELIGGSDRPIWTGRMVDAANLSDEVVRLVAVGVAKACECDSGCLIFCQEVRLKAHRVLIQRGF